MMTFLFLVPFSRQHCMFDQMPMNHTKDTDQVFLYQMSFNQMLLDHSFKSSFEHSMFGVYAYVWVQRSRANVIK